MSQADTHAPAPAPAPVANEPGLVGTGVGNEIPPNNTVYVNNLNEKIKIDGKYEKNKKYSFIFPLYSQTLTTN